MTHDFFSRTISDANLPAPLIKLNWFHLLLGALYRVHYFLLIFSFEKFLVLFLYIIILIKKFPFFPHFYHFSSV